MKRVMAAILAIGLTLPLIATATSCVATDQLGPTFLKLFANPECLQKYGITLPK